MFENTASSRYYTDVDGEYMAVNSIEFNKELLDDSISNIVILDAFLKENDVPFVYCTVPNSTSLKGNSLPTYMNNDATKTYDYVLSSLNENDVNTIDILDYFNNDTSISKGDLYYKFDNHWKTTTELEVSNYILEQLNYDFTTLDETNMNLDTYEDYFVGHYGRYIGYGYRYNQTKDEYTVIYPKENVEYTVQDLKDNSTMSSNYLGVYNLGNITKKEKYTQIYDTNYGSNISNKIIVNNAIDNDKTIVILGDSFSKSITAFLSLNFKTVVQIDNRSINDGDAFRYIEQNIDDIDLVLGLNTVASNNSVPKLFQFFGEE